MKVIQTLVATGLNGQDLGDVEPVDIKFYEGDSLPAAMAAVASIMAESTELRFTRAVAIRVDF